MDFSYSPRLAELKESAVDLTRKIAAYEDECESNNGLCEESRAALRRTVLASGLQAMNAPVEWGGAGLSWTEQVVVEEELGTLTNGLWAAVWRPTAAALIASTPEQRERYLIPENRGERFGARAITEPDAGSDPRLMATVAEPTPGGYRISGEKWFVTLGDLADYLIVLAVVQPEGAPTMFLVDKDLPGVRLLDTPRYTHNFAYEHPHFALDGVEVGHDAVLGEVGGGLALVQATFFEERILVAAHALGAAERALRLASDWARERVQGGKPIIKHQLIQAMLADSATDITVNRTLVYRIAWEIDQGGDPKTLNAKVAMAKVSATEAAGRVVDRAVQIFGGRGYIRDNPVERLYRDVRVDRIWMGTSEVQRLMIANEIDKRGLSGLLHFSTAAEALDTDALLEGAVR